MKNTIKLFEAMRSIAIIAIVAVIGFSFVACDSGGGGGGGGGAAALHGKWLLDGAASGYTEFKSNGDLVIYPAVMPSTYSVKGSTITVKIYGQVAGTATFEITGEGEDAVLTISSSNVAALIDGTYHRFTD